MQLVQLHVLRRNFQHNCSLGFELVIVFPINTVSMANFRTIMSLFRIYLPRNTVYRELTFAYEIRKLARDDFTRQVPTFESTHDAYRKLT